VTKPVRSAIQAPAAPEDQPEQHLEPQQEPDQREGPVLVRPVAASLTHIRKVKAPQGADTPRIFSGIQPSGGLTLGNYLGALKRFVEKQDEGIETIYCLVDMHAITVWQDPAEAAPRHARGWPRASSRRDRPGTRSILFNQSQVTAHAELGWIFNCVARMGWMSRMTQFKDKAGKNSEASRLGLFAYPALMAADILATTPPMFRWARTRSSIWN
jgi:hypothetical protein